MLVHDLNCDSCIQNKKSVFSVLSPEERDYLEKNNICKKFNTGEIIFNEGDTPLGLICLSRGKVKVFKSGIGGKEQMVRMARPTGFIGYRALFAGENHTATAVALEDSVACIIAKRCVFDLLKSNSELSLSIIKAFASELGLTINRTVTLTQKHIRGRLAESLIFLKDTYGFEEDGQTLKVYLAREDIASLSNMTTSNAIRTLTSFSGENVIKLDGRKIIITDINKLEKISDMG